MFAGINIILAVSLNLINGFTGQFSIGHAGFMAVGAYSSAYLTVYHGQGVGAYALRARSARRRREHRRLPARHPRRRAGRGARGAASSASRLCVCRRLPRHRHARLRRDHPHRHPEYRRGRRRDRLHRSRLRRTFCGSALFAVITIVVVRNIVNSDIGPRAHLDPRGRTGGRGDGRQHDALQGARLRHRLGVRGHRGRALRALQQVSAAPTIFSSSTRSRSSS